MKYMNLLNINLRLFDGAAAAAGAGAEGAAGEGASAAPAESAPKAGKGRKAKANPYSNVVFGKQADQSAAADEVSGKGETAPGDAAADPAEAKRQAYRELIEGEYREQYVEDTQRIVKERLKDHKAMEATLNDQKPIMDMLMLRYGIEDGSLASLRKAMEQDTSYWEKEADNAGMPLDEYMKMKQWERDSKELQKLRSRQQTEGDAQNLLIQLRTNEAQVKQVYPNFDLKTELKDRNFFGLLNAGISMQMAYEMCHMKELQDAAVRAAVQTTEQQMATKMKSKSSRPSENGTASKSAVVVKSDVSKLTREDRAEIARRVARGESISF